MLTTAEEAAWASDARGLQPFMWDNLPQKGALWTTLMIKEAVYNRVQAFVLLQKSENSAYLRNKRLRKTVGLSLKDRKRPSLMMKIMIKYFRCLFSRVIAKIMAKIKMNSGILTMRHWLQRNSMSMRGSASVSCIARLKTIPSWKISHHKKIIKELLQTSSDLCSPLRVKASFNASTLSCIN